MSYGGSDDNVAIFPELMDPLDPRDTKRSLETLERYIRYMVERIEFAASKAPERLNTVMAYSAMAADNEEGAHTDGTEKEE